MLNFITSVLVTWDETKILVFPLMNTWWSLAEKVINGSSEVLQLSWKGN